MNHMSMVFSCKDQSRRIFFQMWHTGCISPGRRLVILGWPVSKDQSDGHPWNDLSWFEPRSESDLISSYLFLALLKSTYDGSRTWKQDRALRWRDEFGPALVGCGSLGNMREEETSKVVESHMGLSFLHHELNVLQLPSHFSPKHGNPICIHSNTDLTPPNIYQ